MGACTYIYNIYMYINIYLYILHILIFGTVDHCITIATSSHIFFDHLAENKKYLKYG